MEEKNLKLIYEIRLCLHTQNIEKLMKLLPSLSYEEALSFIRDYQDNFEALCIKERNGEPTIKEENKEAMMLEMLMQMAEPVKTR